MNEYSMATRPQIPAAYHQGAPTYSAAGQLPNWAPNQHYQIPPSPNPPITQYQPPPQQPPGNPQMYYPPRY